MGIRHDANLAGNCNHKLINLDVTHVDSMLRHYGDKRRLLVVTWSVSAVTAGEVKTSFRRWSVALVVFMSTGC